MPLPSRVADLLQFPAPDSPVGVQRFLGMINYYRHFVPKMTHSLSPLHSFPSSKSKSIVWTNKAERAFQDAKQALATAVLLQPPNPFSVTSITVDASDRAVGAKLSQRGHDQTWKPLAFFPMPSLLQKPNIQPAIGSLGDFSGSETLQALPG